MRIKLSGVESDTNSHVPMDDNGVVAEGIVYLSFVEKESEDLGDGLFTGEPIEIEMTISQWETMRDRINAEIESANLEEYGKMVEEDAKLPLDKRPYEVAGVLVE
jgi:hypothetical protein